VCCRRQENVVQRCATTARNTTNTQSKGQPEVPDHTQAFNEWSHGCVDGRLLDTSTHSPRPIPDPELSDLTCAIAFLAPHFFGPLPSALLPPRPFARV